MELRDLTKIYDYTISYTIRCEKCLFNPAARQIPLPRYCLGIVYTEKLILLPSQLDRLSKILG